VSRLIRSVERLYHVDPYQLKQEADHSQYESRLANQAPNCVYLKIHPERTEDLSKLDDHTKEIRVASGVHHDTNVKQRRELPACNAASDET
jgi:hypothetical protein